MANHNPPARYDQLVPFKPGHDPRRHQGARVSPAEREFRAALESEHIPRASAILREIGDRALDGDVKAAELFFKVCGLIVKPSDSAAIQEQARALLAEMIKEARERRAAEG
jgi:hypothetical protein